MAVRLDSVTTDTLRLQNLDAADVVSISLTGGKVLAGRLLLVPNGQDVEPKLWLGVPDTEELGKIDWMAGPQLLGMDSVPRNGKFYYVVVHGAVTTGEELFCVCFMTGDNVHALGRVDAISKMFEVES